MPSLWVDLLQLHGHVTDAALLRRLADLPAASESPEASRDASPADRVKQVMSRWRLCLGIGDGAMRTQ